MQAGEPDDARRAYWIEQMDAGHEFMMKMLDYPVEECGEGMASLRGAVEDAGVEVVFADTQVGWDFDRIFYVRESLIEGFQGAAREMNERGWVMKVEDGYRTREIQKSLARIEKTFDVILRKVLWERSGVPPSPEDMLRRVTALIATCPKIGTHMSGSAIDISVFHRDTGDEVDRGGPYIEISELTPMASPFISDEARRNRDEITAVMAQHGLAAYPYEFWHYSSGDAYDEYLNGTGKPGRYGPVDFDPATGSVTPIESPKEPLNSLDEIKSEIEAALERIA